MSNEIRSFPLFVRETVGRSVELFPSSSFKDRLAQERSTLNAATRARPINGGSGNYNWAFGKLLSFGALMASWVNGSALIAS